MFSILEAPGPLDQRLRAQLVAVERGNQPAPETSSPPYCGQTPTPALGRL